MFHKQHCRDELHDSSRDLFWTAAPTHLPKGTDVNDPTFCEKGTAAIYQDSTAFWENNAGFSTERLTLRVINGRLRLTVCCGAYG